MRGTLQGEQFYLDRDSLDDHESEESGKIDDKDKGSDIVQDKVKDTLGDKDNDKGNDNDNKDKDKGNDKDKDKEGSSLWSWLATTLTPTKPPAPALAPAPAPALTRAIPDSSCLFVGKYADQRAKMDYSYHSHYQPDRQVMMVVEVSVC